MVAGSTVRAGAGTGQAFSVAHRSDLTNESKHNPQTCQKRGEETTRSILKI
jgi:hypothetical protein